RWPALAGFVGLFGKGDGRHRAGQPAPALAKYAGQPARAARRYLTAFCAPAARIQPGARLKVFPAAIGFLVRPGGAIKRAGPWLQPARARHVPTGLRSARLYSGSFSL